MTGQEIWPSDRLETVPQCYEAEGFADGDVKGLFYDGEDYQGKPTRVFAWFGMPKAAEGAKVPGVVLVHGGGGTAFAEWVKLWNERGYAAIAMDTCGCVPRGEYSNWERHQWAGISEGKEGANKFDAIDEKPQGQWTYQAVMAVIRGHSLLRRMEGVDPERIGITGISWGGYLTCITAGLDDRFKGAAVVYGCGFLGENSAWLEVLEKLGTERRSKWLRQWDPSQYLPMVQCPTLWVTGTNDFAYPMDSLQKSYRQPKTERRLSIKVRMDHGHNGPGEKPQEIHTFMNAVLHGETGLNTAGITEQNGNELTATWSGKRNIVAGHLNYTTDGGKWPERYWNSEKAKIDTARRVVQAKLPEGTTAAYFNVTDDEGNIISSEHITLE